MKEIKHEILGNFSFDEEQCVWRKRDKLTLFDKEFDVNIDIIEYDEEYNQGIEFEEYAYGNFQDEQVDALVKFYDNRLEILSNVEDAIFNYYQEKCEEYREYESNEARKDQIAPIISRKDEIGNLVEDMGIFISEQEENSLRKIGITFECTWEHHGLGVLLINKKIVAVGTIDDAIV